MGNFFGVHELGADEGRLTKLQVPKETACDKCLAEFGIHLPVLLLVNEHWSNEYWVFAIFF